MSQQKSSEKSIDNFNKAQQNPKYAVLDDINIDLFTIFTFSLGVFSYIFRTAYTPLIICIIFTILLRVFFPLPVKPTGLTLITGSSSGIGAEYAYIFAKNGNDLLLVARNEEQLSAVKANCEKLGVSVKTYAIDLSTEDAPKKLYDWVKSEGYQVDVLVNNAALGHAGDVMEQTEEMAIRMIGVNITALVVLTQLFGKDMVSRGKGWILETSSVVGFMVGPGQNIYHATKHFVRAFAEAMSVELRGTGVQLTQLLPGPVKTQFVTRGHLEQTFTFSSSGSVEEAKDVAKAGYDGLVKRKRMVFSSWGAAFMATSMHLMPRSLHLTVGSLMNTPTKKQMDSPVKNQEGRM